VAALTVRDLLPDEYPVARRLVATAFAGEPFAVGMFGEDPVDRLIGMTREYATWPDVDEPLLLAIEADGVLLGAALATFPGACHLCSHDGATSSISAADTRAAEIEQEFQARCRAAHLEAELPPHGHIITVATEHFIQGAGAGRRLVDALVARLVAAGAHCVVLECVTGRERFYTACGFRRVSEFPDPGGPDHRCLLMRLDPA
jgi:ribosomal protein S18 acetylase RimI-like enzyme